MIKSTLKIVCDSGPVIHLDELNCLHLLEDFLEERISSGDMRTLRIENLGIETLGNTVTPKRIENHGQND